MSLHFHALTIQNIQQETKDCVSISFNIPAHLKEQFVYVCKGKVLHLKQ
jgi:ferredoxin-NADP reductase